MKKIFLSLLFFLLISFTFPQTAQAACNKSYFCLPSQTPCIISSEQYCCDTPNDCVILNNNPQACTLQGACYPNSWTCGENFESATGCSTDYKCGTNCSAPSTSTGSDVSKCDDNTAGIQTAIGCIHVLGSSEEFLSDILRWAVGIGGGIAFLLILYAGFMIMTASGSPDRLKAGQELLTSAISGLILLIFSVFILKFIGVDILGLCNFGFGGKCPK
jgi:hypothetical protein